MQEVIGVLSGAFLSGLASLSIGMILFRRLSIKLARAESISLAFVAGAACFSQSIFVLSSIHLARKGSFIALALLAAAAAFGGSRGVPAAARFRPLPRSWQWFAAALFAVSTLASASTYRVDSLTVSDGAVTGVTGHMLEPSAVARGQASSRIETGEFEPVGKS